MWNDAGGTIELSMGCFRQRGKPGVGPAGKMILSWATVENIRRIEDVIGTRWWSLAGVVHLK